MSIEKLIGQAVLISFVKLVAEDATDMRIVIAVLFPAFMSFRGFDLTDLAYVLLRTPLIPVSLSKGQVSEAMQSEFGRVESTHDVDPHLIPDLLEDAVFELADDASGDLFLATLVALEVLLVFDVGGVAVLVDDSAAVLASYF